jgi:hypothetical protein
MNIITRPANHNLYVEQLFELLNRRRLETLREHGIERTHAEPELAQLGLAVTVALFNALVASHPQAVEQGTLNVEALWEDFTATGGYAFAQDLIEPKPLMPVDLWKWFVESVVVNAALSFSQVAGGEADSADAGAEAL